MRVTTPNADTPTCATPPETLPTPFVISLVCLLTASSELLPELMKLPNWL